VKNSFCYIIFIALISAVSYGQNADTLTVTKEKTKVLNDSLNLKKEIDPLAPSRAAFYSAILPGLGQAYNKRYWKIPIIYAGMATGVYFYLQNDKDYDRFRDAYKRRLAGYTDDEFWGEGSSPLVSTERLIDAQERLKRNKDLSIVVSVAFYLLNIVDANVDAHLQQFNVSEDLSVQPQINFDTPTVQPNYGFRFTFNLK
jgi:hypothetical protein